MIFIGRNKELEILRNSLIKKESSFIAVYGRRRIGKTFLVDYAFNYDYFFSTIGVYPKRKEDELFQFVNSLIKSGAVIDEKNYPRKWNEAFSILESLIEREKAKKKKVIFIDELAWISSPNTEFLSALGSFWNGFASKRDDVILIVCASSASWMIDHVIHNKGGLYQRLTDQIYLSPFTLKEIEELCEAYKLNLDRYSILIGYMALGGVPLYWIKMNPKFSIDQNLDYLFLDENAPLRNEFEFLYSSLFENATPYVNIIDALGHEKINLGLTRKEILARTKLTDNGIFTKYLKELENCGFIRHFRQSYSVKKEALYQIIDPFTNFYFGFLEKEINDRSFFSKSVDLPKRKAWNGLAFEKICILHIEQIKKALQINSILNDVSSFSVKRDEEKGIEGSQIDLVISRRDRVINLCEIKFSNSTFVIDKKYDEILRRKVSDFVRKTRTKYSIKLVMITTFGLFENAYSKNITSSITLDDLFK